MMRLMIAQLINIHVVNVDTTEIIMYTATMITTWSQWGRG